VDVEKYRQRLQAMERDLVRKLGRDVAASRQQPIEEQRDAGDQSMVGELRDEYLALAQSEADTLAQVRAALARIEQGTFGHCLVDGEPIEEQRLNAVPWTPYCVKHQEEAEASRRTRPPGI
jgi:DnaK suppressor protein